MGHEATGSPDLDGEEVCGCENIPMSSEEVPPLRSLSAFWCRYDSMFLENVGDRGASYDVSEVIESPEDSRVTPGCVLVGEADNELADLGHDSWAAPASTSGEVMLQRNELSVPAKNGVGQKQRGDPEQSFPSDGLGLHSKATPLIVREPRTPRPMQLEQNAVLFDQVIDHTSVVAIQPTGGRCNENVQRRKDSIRSGNRRRTARPKRR